MSSDSEPMYVENVLEANVSHSKGCAIRRFKGSTFRHKHGKFTVRRNLKQWAQLKSDLSTYVAKREKRKDDSIFLRHMDDVVGTGPEEHLMRDFEHMKTSLLLTDVVVLRNTGDREVLGS